MTPLLVLAASLTFTSIPKVEFWLDDAPLPPAVVVVEPETEKSQWENVAVKSLGIVLTAGIDLYTTKRALDACPECREANPLGIDSNTRIYLKASLALADVVLIKILDHYGLKQLSAWIHWATMASQMAFAVNNVRVEVVGGVH